jgi:hypothetical protein
MFSSWHKRLFNSVFCFPYTIIITLRQYQFKIDVVLLGEIVPKTVPKWDRWLSWFVYLICLATLIRFGRDLIKYWTPSIQPGIDLQIYYDATQAFLRGADPFDVHQLHLGRDDTPIVFPPQMVLIAPFYLLGEKLGAVVFLIVNLALSFVLFRRFFQQLDIWHLPTSFTLSRKNQLCLLSLCVFFFSPQFHQVVYSGQLALVAVACLFLALLVPGVLVRAFLLALAVAAKFSLVPFVGLAFLILRDVWTCVLAIVLFIAIALLPILFGYEIYSLYLSYALKVADVIGNCGPDTYCGGGGPGMLLNFDFFTETAINNAVKLIFCLLFAIAFIQEYRSKKVSLNFLLFATAMTLLTAYHRNYDLVALQLLIIACINVLFYQRRWTACGIFTALLLFSLLPIRWMLAIESHLGIWIGQNPWIYVESFGAYPLVFPLFAVYLFILTCYIAYFYFHEDHIEFVR